MPRPSKQKLKSQKASSARWNPDENIKKEKRRIDSSSQDTSDEEFIPTDIEEIEYSKELIIELMEYCREIQCNKRSLSLLVLTILK